MNRKTTLILLGVLLVLGAYTYYYQVSKKAPQPTPTSMPSTAVWYNTTPDQITALQITENASGKQVAVSKDAQSQWQVTKPNAQPADPNALSTLTTNLATLSFMANITSTADLAPFGLITPTYTLEATLSTGKALKAYIGDKIPTGNGFYLLRDGDKNPLAVPDTSLQPFIDLLANPPYVPTPTPLAAPGAVMSPTASP